MYTNTCPATVMGAVVFKRLVSANHMHSAGRHSHGLAGDVRGVREANISALRVRGASDVLAPAVGIPNAMTSRRSHLRSSWGEERHVAHEPNPREDIFDWYVLAVSITGTRTCSEDSHVRALQVVASVPWGAARGNKPACSFHLSQKV